MFKSIVSVALFAASALGAIQFTSAPTAIEAGKEYTFSWTSDNAGPVTILLKNGPSTNLQTAGTIGTSSGTTGTIKWTAPSTYPPGTYSFEIDQGTDVNYWIQVPYTGGTAGASAAPSVAPSAAAPSASAPAASGASSKAPAASASAHVSSVARNVTTSSTTLSSSKSSSSSASNTPAKPTVVQSTNSAASFGSPIALVLGALAAMLYLQ